MTSFNAASGASADSGGSPVASQAITIPAGVAAGDIVFLVAEGVASGSTAPGFSVTTTGTAWTQVGTTQATTNGSDANGLAVFWIEAAAGDLGLSITVNSTGVNSYMSLALASWGGANGSTPVDVSGSAGASNPTSSVTCPVRTTGVDGDWALYCGGGLCESGVLVVPSGSTQRVNHRSAATVAAAIADSNGSVGTAGTSIGGGAFTVSGGSVNWICVFTIGLAPPGGTGTNVTGVGAGATAAGGTGTLSAGANAAGGGAAGTAVSGPGAAVTLTVTLTSSSGGIDTYSTTFAGNGSGAQDMRVVAPVSPGPYPHGFLWLLNPDAGQGTTFGDPVATVTAGGWQDQYNLTLIEPGFAVQPWLADNPDDPAVLQESFLLTLVAWVSANLATGGEQHYLIGFSRTGYGGMSAIFRNPGAFAKAAGWDIPATNTQYTDSTAGGVYGDQVNYASNYQLSSANIARWRDGSDFASANRIWVGGYNALQTQTEAYDSLLTTLGVLHTFTEVAESVHSWSPSPGWAGSAIASMLGGVIAGTGAAVSAAAGAGMASASANVTGIGAAVTAAGGSGTASGLAGVAGVAAAAVAAGGTGTLTADADIAGAGALAAAAGGTGSPSGGGSTVITDSDSCHAEDSGFTFITDAEACTAAETAVIVVRDSDHCTAAERELTRWPQDADACTAADRGWQSGPVQGGADACTTADAGEVIRLADTDACTALDDAPDVGIYTFVPSWRTGPGGGWYEVVWTHPLTGQRMQLAGLDDGEAEEVLRLARRLVAARGRANGSGAGRASVPPPEGVRVTVSVVPALELAISVSRDIPALR